MAELLVLAKAGYTNPDAVKDRRACYKKGDIVVVVEDGHSWGGLEGPPDFVIVKVPGVTLAQAEQYRDHWRVELAYSVVSSDPATDTFTIQVSNSIPGAANQAALTRAQVEAFLNGWGATVVSVGMNQVTFTVRIFDALTSSGFYWGADLTRVVFTEQSYDQATGTHTIQANYAGTNWPGAAVPHMISDAGGTLISNAGRVAVFTMTRATARTAFQNDVYTKARTVWKRRRWGFSSADVDTALGLGGVLTLTAQQVVNHLIDSTVT